MIAYHAKIATVPGFRGILCIPAVGVGGMRVDGQGRWGVGRFLSGLSWS